MKRFMRLGIAALLFVALGAVFAAAAQATTYTYLELGFSEEPEIGKSIPFTVIVKSSKPDNQIAGIARATWTDLTDGSRELTKSDKFLSFLCLFFAKGRVIIERKELYR